MYYERKEISQSRRRKSSQAEEQNFEDNVNSKTEDLVDDTALNVQNASATAGEVLMSEKDVIRAEKKRRNNAIQSARKRERQKKTADKLKRQYSDLYETNLALFRKNQVLEDLLTRATALVNPGGQQNNSETLILIQNDNTKAKSDSKMTLESPQATCNPWSNMLIPGTVFDQLQNNSGVPDSRVTSSEMSRLSDANAMVSVFPGACASVSLPAIQLAASAIQNSSVLLQFPTSGPLAPGLPPTLNHMSLLSQDALAPGLIDMNILYQTLLPTLFLIEAGVDPLPILQQKILHHLSSIHALTNREDAVTKLHINKDELPVVNVSSFPETVNTSVVGDLGKQYTAYNPSNTISPLLQENNIQNIAQRMLQQWMDSKRSGCTDDVNLADRKLSYNSLHK
jgi:hypothetical protein